MAMEGTANITGVPALGLPKIRSLVGRIFIPTFCASPLWSISAKSVAPFSCNILLSVSTVWSTECLLGIAMMPFPVIVAVGVSLLLCESRFWRARSGRDHNLAAPEETCIERACPRPQQGDCSRHDDHFKRC